jgi:RNA polymerase sigma factor (sigma-70 family)
VIRTRKDAHIVHRADIKSKMSDMTGTQKHSISDLLQRLNSADAGAAWVAFIDRFAPLMMKTVTQFDYRQDRSNECFVYICEKLSDQDFRRLQKFNTAGTSKFRHWLSTVVFNLCVDWHRTEFGRATVLPAITALPAFDQLIYRYIYQQGMSRHSCYQTIKSDFPELTKDQLSASLSRIHSLLTPRQRWRLRARSRRALTAGAESPGLHVSQVQDPGLDPESLAQAQEQATNLQTALSRLSIDHRLLLQLRFQEGLTFERIARLEQLGNAHRARRYVQAALDALYCQLQKVNIGRKRQN